jgi:hypothetical protein
MKRSAFIARLLIVAQCLFMLSSASHVLTLPTTHGSPSPQASAPACHANKADAVAMHATTHDQGASHGTYCIDCAACSIGYLHDGMRELGALPGNRVMTSRLAVMSIDTSVMPERKPPRA